MSKELPCYSIIIPAHNEEQRISATLRDYAEKFSDGEILVVLNGCTDNTAAIVANMQMQHPNISQIDISAAVGKGGAVRAGFLAARAPLIGFADADGATSAGEMRRLFALSEDVDGIIGSRWAKDARIESKQPLMRRFASRVFNRIVRILFGLPFHDTQCGAKVFKADVLRGVIAHIETSNMAFDVDLLFACKNIGAVIKEVPTTWSDVPGTQVRLAATSAKMLAALVRLRIRHSFLRVIVPLFDKVFPTTPLRHRDGLSILILNWRDPTHPQSGGAETYLFELARRWVACGNTVEWITASYRGAPKYDLLDGVQICRVGNAFTVYLWAAIEYLRRYRDRFDIIVDSENGIPFFSPLYSLKPKICVMHHVHRSVFRSQLPFPISEMFVWLEGWAMPRAYRNARFVAVSTDTKSEMEHLGMSSYPIEVVMNGVDPSLAPGPKAPIPTVIYLGRLKAYKRVDLLLRSFARVLTEIPTAELKIAGSGDALDALIELTKELGISTHVQFEGHVSEQRKAELLQSAWAFISPSEKEGWGISVIEANACGTPAIAFAVPGLREAIQDGISGLLVPDGSDLSEPVTRILRDADLRQKLSAGALSRSRDFTWSDSAQKFLAIITESLALEAGIFMRNGGAWDLMHVLYDSSTPQKNVARSVKRHTIPDAAASQRVPTEPRGR